MKKIVSTIAALGLVAGLASTAMATDVEKAQKSDTEKQVVKPTAAGVDLFSVTGVWAAAGLYISDGDGGLSMAGGGVELNNNNSAGYLHEQDDTAIVHVFTLKPTLNVNDRASVTGELRFSDRDIFGYTDLIAPGTTSNGRDIDAYTLWAKYNSPYGMLQVGRTPAGAWGPSFANSSTQANRIIFSPSAIAAPFSLTLFAEKKASTGEYDAVTTTADEDQNNYYAGLSHKADMGKTDAAIYWVRDAKSNPGADVVNNYNLWLAGNYNFGAVNVVGEFDYSFGDASATMDKSAIGAMVDVSTKLADTKVGLLYFYMSGDDDSTDMDVNNFLGAGGTGNDFNPYLILTGDYMGVLNADKGAVDPLIVSGAYSAGVSSLGIYGSFQASDKLTLSGAIGTAWANEAKTGQDESYGWEFDVTANYAVYSNLTYTVHFGYLNTGDFFEGVNGAYETTNVYMMAHQLTMSF